MPKEAQNAVEGSVLGWPCIACTEYSVLPSLTPHNFIRQDDAKSLSCYVREASYSISLTTPVQRTRRRFAQTERVYCEDGTIQR